MSSFSFTDDDKADNPNRTNNRKFVQPKIITEQPGSFDFFGGPTAAAADNANAPRSADHVRRQSSIKVISDIPVAAFDGFGTADAGGASLFGAVAAPASAAAPTISAFDALPATANANANDDAGALFFQQTSTPLANGGSVASGSVASGVSGSVDVTTSGAAPTMANGVSPATTSSVATTTSNDVTQASEFTSAAPLAAQHNDNAAASPANNNVVGNSNSHSDSNSGEVVAAAPRDELSVSPLPASYDHPPPAAADDANDASGADAAPSELFLQDYTNVANAAMLQPDPNDIASIRAAVLAHQPGMSFRSPLCVQQTDVKIATRLVSLV
jgi:hypothetical protein